MVILMQAGCLLPFLIAFNFAFGWIFLGWRNWLITELILVLLFILNVSFMARRLTRGPKRGSGVIDVEGHIVEDKERHKLK